MTRSRYALMLFITILFGLIAGLLLSYPLRYAFSLDWPFDTGYIPDVKLFFRWRAIARWSLLTISLAYAVFSSQRILWKQRISLLFTLLWSVAYVAISIGFYPEISPIQFLMEGRVARTSYADDFRRDTFLRIAKGMTKNDVSKLAGFGFSEDRFLEL